MIESYRRKTNTGVLLGFLLVGASIGMAQMPGALPAVFVIWLTGCGSFVWGCTQYAKGKGHSGWWGALGLIGFLGLVLLVFLPDRHASGQRVRKADLVHLFPSDARVLLPEVQPGAPDPNAPRREFGVRFGSAVAIDEFGFVREGRVALAGNSLVYQGPRHWSVPARVGVFLGLGSVTSLLLGPLIGASLTLALLHYFAASQGRLVLAVPTILNLRRNGRKLSFQAVDPESGTRRKSVLRLESEEDALEFERALAARPVSVAA